MAKKPPKRPRPDNAVLALRKRRRKRVERDTNPDVLLRRMLAARHAERAEELKKAKSRHARKRVTARFAGK
jgi:hypothetical protein